MFLWAMEKPDFLYLHRHYAVPADVPLTHVVHGRLPERHADPLPAQPRSHDVEPHEAEGAVVGHRRDASRRPVPLVRHKETLRIGGMEADRVADARVPPLRGGPGRRQFQILLRHGPDGNPILQFHCARLLSAGRSRLRPLHLSGPARMLFYAAYN
jgi:hypothetical protein